MEHISHYLKAFKDELEEKSLRTGSPQYAGEATAQHTNGGRGEAKKEAAESTDCKANPAIRVIAQCSFAGEVEEIMRLSAEAAATLMQPTTITKKESVVPSPLESTTLDVAAIHERRMQPHPLSLHPRCGNDQ